MNTLTQKRKKVRDPMVRIFVDHRVSESTTWDSTGDMRIFWLLTTTKIGLDLNEIKHNFIGYTKTYNRNMEEVIRFLLRIRRSDVALATLVSSTIKLYSGEKYFDVRDEHTRKFLGLSDFIDEIDKRCSLGISALTYYARQRIPLKDM